MLAERARTAWTEVENQYRRRTEFVPGVVETLRTLAPLERELLAELGSAHARVSRLRTEDATITDPARFTDFSDAQSQLSAAVARIGPTVERYLDVKGNASFIAQLARIGEAEDRIVIARRDYIDAARAYNRRLRAIPDRWVAAFFHPEAQPMQIFSTARLNQPERR